MLNFKSLFSGKKIPEAIEKQLDNIATVIDWVADAFTNGHRLFYMGAGTSGRLGVLDASECPPTFGVPKTMVVGLIAGGDTALRNAIEKAEDSKDFGANDLKAHDLKQLKEAYILLLCLLHNQKPYLDHQHQVFYFS